MIVNDRRFIDRAEIIREKGTNRARFFRGQIDKYGWVDLGSSYVMSDVLAAFLFAQLEQWKTIQEKRRIIWDRYDEALADWADTRRIRRPVIPPHCHHTYHMYYVLMPSLAARTDFISHLKKHDVFAVFHYLPLDRSEYASKAYRKTSDCRVSQDVSDRLVRLPFFTSMTAEQQDHVIDSIKRWPA